MKRRREEAKTRIRKRKKKRYIVSNIHVIGETTIHIYIYIYIYTHIKYEIRITRKEAKRRRRTEGNNQYNRGRESATIKEEEKNTRGERTEHPKPEASRASQLCRMGEELDSSKTMRRSNKSKHRGTATLAMARTK